MKEVRAPGDIWPMMVKLAPYMTTTITDSVEAAFRLPKKMPTTLCSGKTGKISSFWEWGKLEGGEERGGTHSLFDSKVQCLINFLGVAWHFISFLGKGSHCAYRTERLLQYSVYKLPTFSSRKVEHNEYASCFSEYFYSKHQKFYRYIQHHIQSKICKSLGLLWRLR